MPSKLDKKKVKEAQDKEKEAQSEYKLDLSEDQRKELVERVCYLVEKDEADRQEYMSIRQKVRDIYESKATTKTDPWKNCANVHTQLTLMSVELLHSRLFPAAWNEDLIYWKPMEKNDIDNIEKIGKFMKWVVAQMGMGNIIDDYVHNLILDGTAVMKIRWVNEWKWIQRKIQVEGVKNKIQRVVMNWIGGKRKYEIPKTKYKIEYEYKKFEKCKAEVIDIEDVGFPTYSVPQSKEEELEYIWHRTYPTYAELKELEAMGIYENVDDVGSSIEEIAVKGTKKSDIEAEGTRITQNKLNKTVEVIELYDKYDYNNDGVREDIIITVEKKSKTLLDARLLLALSRINERPFVIGQFIRRPNRMYGKGAGEIAMPVEEEANAIHNQRLDAGTMSIIPFGVYRAGSGFKPENIEMAPGLWVPVDDINDAKWVTVPNNVMVSFQEERMLMELLEKILSVGSYQSGQESDTNRSRATARGTLAIIQQGEIRFAILGRRVQMPLLRALTKILHQYQDKIPPGLGMRVLGADGEQLFPDGIAPEDIAGNYDAYMVLDFTGGSKAADQNMKIQIYQQFAMNPLVQRNPSGFWKLSADVLKAANVEEVEEILGPRPVVNQISKNVQDENALMLQGQKVKISPADNILEHLLGHYAFRDSADFFMMPPEYRVNFDEHIEATKMQLAESINKFAMNAQQDFNQAQQPNMQQPMQPQLPQGGMSGPETGEIGNAPPNGGMGTAPTENEGGAGMPGQENANQPFSA